MAKSIRILSASLFAFTCLTLGCGDDGNGDGSGTKGDAGTNGDDAGMNGDGGSPDPTDPSYDEDAGPPAEIPEPDSKECTEAFAEDFTPYEEAMCASQAEPEEAGNCGGFFCNWTEDQILCQMDSMSACGSETELRLACDMTLQDTVADCAREKVFADDFETAVLACAWEAIEEPVSRDCLTCYVESADCAKKNCVQECLSGDSPDCDACRQEAKCTPNFYECAGVPNPEEVNPDGADR